MAAKKTMQTAKEIDGEHEGSQHEYMAWSFRNADDDAEDDGPHASTTAAAAPGCLCSLRSAGALCWQVRSPGPLESEKLIFSEPRGFQGDSHSEFTCVLHVLVES